MLHNIEKIRENIMCYLINVRVFIFVFRYPFFLSVLKGSKIHNMLPGNTQLQGVVHAVRLEKNAL